jgi:hypothetical protein
MPDFHHCMLANKVARHISHLDLAGLQSFLTFIVGVNLKKREKKRSSENQSTSSD